MTNILVIGDAGVGKTTLINNLIGKPFISQYLSTSQINLVEYNDYNFIDIPGQLKYSLDFSSINYDIVFIVYDLSNSISYSNLNFWIKKIYKPFIIIGNKSDCTLSVKLTNLIRSTSKQFDNLKLSCKNKISIKELLSNYLNKKLII